MSERRVKVVNGILHPMDDCQQCGRRRISPMGVSLDVLHNSNTWKCCFCRADNVVDLGQKIRLISDPVT